MVVAVSCAACGTRNGLVILSPSGLAGPSGVFNNDIIRNTAAAGTSFTVFETDKDSAPASFLNNDLWDTVGTLYTYQGTTALGTTALIDSTVSGAGSTLSADPLLSGTWHIPGASP